MNTDTPESDSAYESFEDTTHEVLRHFVSYDLACKLERERNEWKANHDNQVEEKRQAELF